jgi:hypothetical protein
MSQVKRKGLKFIIDQIGKAKYIYKNLVGDLTVNRGLFLDYEAIVPKIKGKTPKLVSGENSACSGAQV